MAEDEIGDYVPNWYYDVVSDEDIPPIYDLYEDELPPPGITVDLLPIKKLSPVGRPIHGSSPIKNKLIPKYETYKPSCNVIQKPKLHSIIADYGRPRSHLGAQGGPRPHYMTSPFKYTGYNSGTLTFTSINLNDIDRIYLKHYYANNIKILSGSFKGQKMRLVGWKNRQPIMETEKGVPYLLPSYTKMEVNL